MKILWIFVYFIIGVTVVLISEKLTSGQEQGLVEEIKGLAVALDNRSIARSWSNRDYAVALFQQIMERNPDQDELDTMEHLLNRSGVRRSQLLALLLRKKENGAALSHELLQKRLPLLRKLQFNTPPSWKPMALKSPETKPSQPYKREECAHRGNYKLFHGYLHAHTSYSDGRGTPEEAYTMVRDVVKLDFFAVTDHAELISIWPWDNEWEKLKNTAASFNQDHKFVALHGFEWTSPIYGHINIINTAKLTSCADHAGIQNLFGWLSKQPEAFARFNHPGRGGKPGLEFAQFKLYPEVVKQMTSIEMFNKGKGIDHFSSRGFSDKYNYFDEANLNGWKVGAVGGQDNHKKNWGSQNDFNVGVWATDLTRQGIISAYRDRRTYATEDRNLSLSFKIDEAQMGSCLRNVAGNMVVQLLDPDSEDFSQVSIYKNGALFRRMSVSGSKTRVELKIKANPGDYYYVLVAQADGDKALSSPIWIIE